MKYKDYNDYELINFVKENSEDANEIIFEKYKPFIISTATRMIKSSSNLGLEVGDLIQEGNLGLNTAINNFDDTLESSFFTYAKTCIERKMTSALIAAKRQKHRILNESVPIDILSDDSEIKEIDFLMADNSYNPENVILDYENSATLLNRINASLTPLEQQVFELKIAGFKYREIALILDKDTKVIDNALNRIKAKIKKFNQ